METIKFKILLVEDNKLDQMAFKRMVDAKGLDYDYMIAGSVAEAREILNTRRFDAVISDYSLGDGTAFDVLAMVKNAPVILVTGAGDEEVATKAWREGAYDYLIKDQEQNYLRTIPIAVENAIKHKGMEARLRLLSHAILSTDDSVYITDMEDKITFVNRAFCETYGYKEEEVIGKDCNILWKQNAAKTETDDSLSAVSGWEVGFYHMRKDGGGFPVSLTRSDVKDDNGNEVALVVISRDISERMEIENELRVTNKRLEKQNRLRKELSIAVCQQAEAPLAKLKNIIFNARTGAMGGVSHRLQEDLEAAEKNIERIKGIINDFLDMSQVDGSRMNVDMNEAGLRSVVSQVLKALAPFASEKNIELENLIPDSNAADTEWTKIVDTLNKLVGKMTKQVPENSHSK